MNALKDFLDVATDSQKASLAEQAQTSEGYLRSIAYGNRRPKAELAGRIERATVTISKRSRGRLPVVSRTDICEACAECPFAKACKAAKPEQ